MSVRQAKLTQCGAIGPQAVGNDRLGADALVLQKAAQELQRGGGVAPLLDQHIEHNTLVVDGSPQVHAPPADPHDHLVEVPARGGQGVRAPQVARDHRPELDRPAVNGFVADLYPAGCHQLLDVTQAQAEAEVEPHRLADHLGWEAVALVRDGLHVWTPAASPAPARLRDRLPLD